MSISTLQMPNVFVIPPEEDHSPAWCCFDAAQSLNNQFSRFAERHVESDIDYDSEVNAVEQEWEYHAQDECLSQMPPLIGYRETADDSDVIEVVKVGHHALEDEPTMTVERATDFTRSKTLKQRASRMFSSLKKVGMRKRIIEVASESALGDSGTLRKSEDMEWVCGQLTTPTLPRRSSVLTPQLFATPSSQFQESMTSYPSHPNASPSASAEDAIQDVNSTSLSRAASPTHSFKTKRRFSKINLPRIFSFAATTSSTNPTMSSSVDKILVRRPSTTADQTLGSNSRNSPRTESLDNAYPPDNKTLYNTSKEPLEKRIISSFQKATEDGHPQVDDHPSFAAELSLNLGTDLDLDLDLPTTTAYKPNTPPASLDLRQLTHRNIDGSATKTILGDISFEMRLDSLHFDDLSFDVNRF